MELINNRFRILKSLGENADYSSYLVLDVWKNKEIQLNLLHSQALPDSLIDFYTNDFLDLVSLNHENLIQNYDFNMVTHIDNKRYYKKKYFYTCDYFEKGDIFGNLEGKCLVETIDLFVEILKCIKYLHIKNRIYGGISLENVNVVEGKNGLQVKLKDLATIEMEKQLFLSRGTNYFASKEVTLGQEITKKTDIYSLGILLLCLVTKEPVKDSAIKKLEELEHSIKMKSKKCKNIPLALIAIIKKIIEQKKVYSDTLEIANDLSKITGKQYLIINTEKLDTLNMHPKLVGRDDEAFAVIKSYESMIEYKPYSRIFFVKGYEGSGKTRFFQELKFLLELKGANVLSSFALNNLSDSSHQMWIEILRRLILEADQDIIDKYITELERFFPELSGIKRKNVQLDTSVQNNNKHRLLNRIAMFISDVVKDIPTVFIIDNVHLADEFTIETISYLINSDISKKNLLFLLSYNEVENHDRRDFLEFESAVMRIKDSDVINMKNLSLKQTSEMIKSILSLPNIPMKLGGQIYNHSFGNPLFIIEAIKDFHARKTIWIDPATGEWEITLPEPNGYEKLEIPNSIEHALTNQIANIDLTSNNVLKIISIFNNPVSIDDMIEFNDIGEDDLIVIVQSLVNKGLLSKKIHDNGYLYDFNNKVLKSLVYDNLCTDEKKIKHAIAAKVIERHGGRNVLNDMDELIFHLKMAEQHEKVKFYALDYAEKMKSTKNFKGQVKNLETALAVCTDPLEVSQLLFKIGEILLDMGDSPLAKDYLHRAEAAAIEIMDEKLQLDVSLNLASCYSSEGIIEKYDYYIGKVDELLGKTDYEKARIERKVFEALAHINFNNLEASQKLCEEILDECGEKYIKVRGNALRILGYINLRKNNLEEAIRQNYKSIELLESVNYAKGLLFSLNNIGVIYSEHYGDIEKGIKFFSRVRDLSQEYGLLSTEVLGTVNVGVMTRKNLDFKGAYDNYKHALLKAKKINAQSEIFFIYTALISLCLETDNFEEALYYFDLCNEDLIKYSVQREKKLPIYQAYTFLYQTFGLFDEAGKYLRESIEYESGETGEANPSAIIEGYILDIMSEKVTCYQQIVNSIIEATQNLVNTVEKITTLCEVAKMIGQRGQIECATKLVTEVEKHIDDKTHDYLQAKYFLAKGICEKANGRNHIRKAMLLGKRFNSKTILLESYLEMGDSYLNEQEYYISAYYYVEAWELFKNLIIQLPNEFKLSYANEFSYLRSFYRALYIKELLGIKTKSKFSGLQNIEKIRKVNSLEELQELTNFNLVKLFVNSKKFMERISKKSLAFENRTFKEIDILSNLTGTTIDDMEATVKFLTAKLLATRGLLLINQNNQSMEVVASSDGNYHLPSNKYFFEKVKKNHEPIVVYRGVTGERELSHLKDDIHACICVPITSDYSHGINSNMSSKILGFLYLESDRVLNNFGTDSIKKSSTLNNLLALLIEKHQLKISASIDKLTGTLTRKYLEDTLNNVFENAVEKNEVFSILMYDLDRFKDINDRFGHQTGDDVLAKLSKIIKEELNQSDYIGRYGGEEFVIILPKTSSEEALLISEEIRQRVEDKKILGEKAKVTISIGVASYPEQGRNIMDLVEKADQALYVAKEKGRNRAELWRPEFSSKSKNKDKLRGIISGNTVKDSRNMLAMVELTQLINKNINREEKIYTFIGRMIETIEAQSGCLLFLKNNTIAGKFGRKSQAQGWDNSIVVNENFVKTVATNKEGIYTIDWDDMGKSEFISGISNWNSVIVTPIIVRDVVKGVLYFKISTRHKEFDYSDLSIVNLLGDLLATVL